MEIISPHPEHPSESAIMCKSIKMAEGPPFKVLREFKHYAPKFKDGEIVVTALSVIRPIL